ncbi:group II intron reverse transcriptase/maturase [Ktedonobacter sp. SOSP1-52]|uniref:group II intron reverse transcriptase/maturase n=1 Tax=Ktedonobacter sp. SOSP1-52 TaxID=2778366 RepID=UPI00191598D1|nr:group II intron reverse transcriptase/maturase [Ktedonobacter sp. SOSP1-52]GHO62144.1 group II intron reverse transcriptase/maturase [Ktedonobacter sp. SOSP1-52]GHO64272.1 group II intron reverse transcriptase/maturase [Ktedonobacter sp. SOSP1-52]GHO68195.1 group II intron reverse transcriptase/maturase [Ktedonobacter sp. SOSP1-52]GHO71262.1 group II intron reverse transcriptase/maturase [Ktedonobacter sp. SOSP1-52]
MPKTKAPRMKRQTPLDPESERWRALPWRKFEQHVYRLQKRIFQAQQRGNTQAVHSLQKLLMKSRAARLLAVRRVTQDNQGKKTAGVDGVKSVPPAQRFELAERIHPKHWKRAKSLPVRRVYIPKPGKLEMRPLGIPVMETRSQQALVKFALEPEWESKFEPNSYGFRPGRSCQDAMAAIFVIIAHKAKYVLDADLKGAFDNIRHEALLEKLNTFPTMRRVIKTWLKAGVVDHGVFEETTRGTPQGGVASPLLMNIALYGMETALMNAYRTKTDRPQLVRYADDLVVFHPTEEGVKKAQEVLATWLADMGLELKPSKTRIAHTLREYQGRIGFDFLGFTVRQFPVGKTHSGKANQYGPPLGFKTIITPSKEAVQRHVAEMRTIIKKNRSASQDKLIRELNPVIRGWTNYYRAVAAKRTFSHCGHVLYLQLRSWANSRHPNKNKHWIAQKYWHVDDGNGWIFTDQQGTTLREHPQTPIQRHVKVRGTASPYDGDLLYWSKRLRTHSMFNGMLAKLLQKQQGKCRWCGLLFQNGDLLEVDHITPKSEGGGNEISNRFALHRHCHDQRHARKVVGTSDKGYIIEELDDAKVSCPVLKPSKGGDSSA